MYNPTQNYTESKPLELEESVDIIEAKKPEEQVIDEVASEDILESSIKQEPVITEDVDKKRREHLRRRHMGF